MGELSSRVGGTVHIPVVRHASDIGGLCSEGGGTRNADSGVINRDGYHGLSVNNQIERYAGGGTTMVGSVHRVAINTSGIRSSRIGVGSTTLNLTTLFFPNVTGRTGQTEGVNCGKDNLIAQADDGGIRGDSNGRIRMNNNLGGICNSSTTRSVIYIIDIINKCINVIIHRLRHHCQD